MKKSDLLLIGVIIIIAVIAFVSSKGNIELEEVEYPLTLVGDSGLHQISYEQYNDFVDNGDAFIVVIERAGCGFCIQYMPIVKEVAEEQKIPIYYIDTDTLTQSELSDLDSTNDYLKKNPKWGTPTTLFMLGDRVLDAIDGYVEKNTFLSFIDGKVVVGE